MTSRTFRLVISLGAMASGVALTWILSRAPAAQAPAPPAPPATPSARPAPPAPPAPRAPRPPSGADYAAAVLRDAPLGFWPLDETAGAIARDRTGSGRDGSYVGGIEAGGPGGRVDAGADGVLVPGADWSNLDGFTVEAWVVPSRVTYPEGVLVVDKGNAWGLQVQANGTPAFALPFSRGRAQGSQALAVGRLYHLVGTYESGTISLYVDGELTGRDAAAAVTRTAEPVHIGRGLSPNRFQFEGLIRDVAIYDRVLGAAQIETHYREGAR